MTILRRILPVLVILLVAAAVEAGAQPKRNPNHTLLWKISGNGLEKPSYIYGTMHVTDDRVFDFGDSVLLKLQECDAFAMEIIIDSAARQIYHEAFHPDPNAPDIRDWLDDEQEAALDAAMQRSIGLPLAQVAHARPWLLSMFLEDSEGAEEEGEFRFEMPEPTTRPAIRGQTVDLDSYLYRLARGEGKQILALESIGEQLHLFDSVPFDQQILFLFGGDPGRSTERGEMRRFGESMITLYHRGDLEGLLAHMQSPELPAFYLQKLLTDRNHTMAERIVPQIRSASTFIAVGAGHLPGPEGVLELLRKRGFSVTPVRATRTGLAAQYREKPFRAEWTRFNDRSGAYSIEVPMEPIPIPAEQGMEEMNSRRYLSFDVSRGVSYLISYFDLPATRGRTSEKEMIDVMIDHLAEDAGIVVSRSSDQYAGTFLFRGTDGSMTRGRILIRGQRLYMVMAEGAWSLSRSPDVEKFIRSLALLDYLPSPLHPTISDTLGITARLPGPLLHSLDSGFGQLRYSVVTVVTGTSLDTNTGYTYTIERRSYSPFIRFTDPSSLFEQEVVEILRPGDSIHAMTRMMHHGDSAVDLEIRSEGQRSILRARLIQHGGYVYRILLWMPRERAFSPIADELINSVEPTAERSGDLFASKLPVILETLEGADTTSRAEARYVLVSMRLDEGEKEGVLDLLERPRDDDNAGSESLRYLLLQALQSNTDSTVLPRLRRIYPTLANLPEHREQFRLILASINTRESIEWLADLLMEETILPETPNYDFAYMIARDVRMTEYLFPRVLPLLDHPAYQGSITYLLLQGLDSGIVAPAAIVGGREHLVRMVMRTASDTTNDVVWDAVAGIGILSYLPPDEQTIALFRSIASGSQKDAGVAAALALLRTGHAVERETLERLASSPAVRLDLYRELQKLDSLHLFPERFRTQHAISEAALVEWLIADNETPPDSIVAVDTREVTFEGERRRAYMFKFRYDEESGWRVGLGSLQPVDRDEIDSTDEHAFSIYNTVGDMSIRKHLEVLLEP